MTLSFPHHWESARVDEIADVRMGRQRSPKNAEGDYMRPYLRAANVTWAGLKLDEVFEMNFPPGDYEKYRLQAGDVLVVEASGSASEVGRPVVWRGQVEGCCYQNHLIRVRPREVLSEFVNYFFMHEALTGRFGSAAGGVGINHLGSRRLSAWVHPVPPLAEQRRIVEAIETHLSRIDAGVDNLQRAQRNTDRMRASILKAAVEGRLVPQDPTDEPAEKLLERILDERRAAWEAEQFARFEAKGKLPKTDGWKARYRELPAPPSSGFATPAGWVWATPEQVAAAQPNALAIGPFGSNLKVSDYRTDGTPLVFVRHIRTGLFDGQDPKFVSADKAKELASHRVEKGDLLITKMGDPPGDAAVYTATQPAIITADCIKLTPHREVNVRYLAIAINAPQVRKQILSITRGVAQLKVSLGRFRSGVQIPLPPLAEQRRIVAEVDRQLSILDAMDEAAHLADRRAKALRRSILATAFSGRLVPQDPSDQPATVLLDRIRAEQESSAPL